MHGDIKLLREHADRFRSRLWQAKQELGRVDFESYPHDSLSAFAHVDRLLTGGNRSLFEGSKAVLEIGCQDGEVSFCLESAGHAVAALDHSVYNHNCMRGVRALRETLHSTIDLMEVDIDRQFRLPDRSFDIVVMLGVLYHLRNPFYVLEELARRSTYCLLSTRIARRFPNGKPIPADIPIAYLLAERELNDDETNYFIFSDSALRTLFERTHWTVLDYMTAGRSTDSDPIRPDRDERAFCLLRSDYGRLTNVDTLEGWHEPEGAGWRWTQRRFSARVRSSPQHPPRRLIVDLYLPEEVLRNNNPLRLSISENGHDLSPEVYESAGPHSLVRG